MNYCHVNQDTVLIAQPLDADVWHNINLDTPPTIGPTIRTREVVLTPGEFPGRRVLRAYDQETDTLYIKALP